MLQARERPQAPQPAIDPAAALRGFFAIMQAWKLSVEDARALLGAPAERTFYAWRAGNAVRVPMDTLRRVGYLAGIYKALELLYSDPGSGRRVDQAARTAPSAARRRCSGCGRATSPTSPRSAPTSTVPGRPGAETCRPAGSTGRRPGASSPPVTRRSGCSSG